MPVLSRIKWRSRAALALVIALLLTFSTTALTFASGGVTLLKISSDPYSGVQKD